MRFGCFKKKNQYILVYIPFTRFKNRGWNFWNLWKITKFPGQTFYRWSNKLTEKKPPHHRPKTIGKEKDKKIAHLLVGIINIFLSRIMISYEYVSFICAWVGVYCVFIIIMWCCYTFRPLYFFLLSYARWVITKSIAITKKNCKYWRVGR